MASGCFMGGTCAVWEELGKQKPRSCRTQELARSSARENGRQKKVAYLTQLESERGAHTNKRGSTNYSLRKATMGSTRMARRTGI